LLCSGNLTSPFLTLSHGLAYVPYGGIIIVRGGTYKGTGNTNITLQSAYTTVQGESPETTIIDCESNSNAFNLYSGTFILSGFTIQNCVRNAEIQGELIGGSALALYATDTQLSNIIIKGCTGYGNGGAISVYSNSLFISNSTFENNQVVNGSGGAIWIGSAFVQLNSTTIRSNTASSGKGNDLYCQDASVAVYDSSTIGQQTCVRCSIFNEHHDSLCPVDNNSSSTSINVILIISIILCLLML